VLSLVHSQQKSMSETAFSADILDDMQDASGVFASIEADKHMHLADIALAMRPYVTNDPTCGIANVGGVGRRGDFASQGIATLSAGVVSLDCGDDTTPHEIGHILGLSHSRLQVAAGGASGTFDWSTGYGVNSSFATLMANPGLFDGAVRLMQFSNPEQLCNSVDCGVDRSDLVNGADAALGLNTVVYQVAAFTRDSDGNMLADALDDDDDGDGTPDTADEAPLDASDILDFDLDGLGDAADTDDDADGEPDVTDAFRLDPYEQGDGDGDGIGDNADRDDDNDGIDDVLDPDDDNDGADDTLEAEFGTNPRDARDCPRIICGPRQFWRYGVGA
jgi:hypothetical protein